MLALVCLLVARSAPANTASEPASRKQTSALNPDQLLFKGVVTAEGELKYLENPYCCMCVARFYTYDFMERLKDSIEGI
jgi:hypothetical protein